MAKLMIGFILIAVLNQANAISIANASKTYNVLFIMVIICLPYHSLVALGAGNKNSKNTRKKNHRKKKCAKKASSSVAEMPSKLQHFVANQQLNTNNSQPDSVPSCSYRTDLCSEDNTNNCLKMKDTTKLSGKRKNETIRFIKNEASKLPQAEHEKILSLLDQLQLNNNSTVRKA